MFTSREIEVGGILAISDPTVQAIKEQFAGVNINQYTPTKDSND
jgi:hypothetical protein